jgi:putative nucleotidyltransferase with HDIG domain
MLNIHRILMQKLLVSWVIVSLTIGGGQYLYGIERIDDQLVELAVSEAGKISGEQLRLLNDPRTDKQVLEQIATGLLLDHFIVAELYDRQHATLVEKVNPRFEFIERALKQYSHRFPQDEEPHYERFKVGQHTVLQAVVPLRDAAGETAGYFEGVFLVEPETLQRLHDNLITSLKITMVAVLLTTLVIYPVVLSLNRNLIRNSRDLLKGNIELMEVLGSAIAQRDSDTSAHNYRVTIYAVKLAEAVGLGKEEIRNLIAGAFLHDVGKIGISDNILLKPGKLTEEEFAVMKTHVSRGGEILRRSDWLQTARDVVEFHHEKFDGSGYLRGLKGETIPINARIFAIIDVFDALTSKRPYKEPLSFEEAMEILQKGSGSHFDPHLLDVFAGIAERLYAEVSGLGDKVIEAKLQVVIADYYFPT